MWPSILTVGFKLTIHKLDLCLEQLVFPVISCLLLVDSVQAYPHIQSLHFENLSSLSNVDDTGDLDNASAIFNSIPGTWVME